MKIGEIPYFKYKEVKYLCVLSGIPSLCYKKRLKMEEKTKFRIWEIEFVIEV